MFIVGVYSADPFQLQPNRVENLLKGLEIIWPINAYSLVHSINPQLFNY
jgi:hypothetical protein